MLQAEFPFRAGPAPCFRAQFADSSPKPFMHAYVYKSQRKADTYLYLATRDDFSCLPDALRAQLGELRFVLDVALTPERRLAQADPAVVRANLVSRGFYLQIPPTMADPMTEDWGTDG